MSEIITFADIKNMTLIDHDSINKELDRILNKTVYDTIKENLDKALEENMYSTKEELDEITEQVDIGEL